jgi:23S rRNA pseudouridine1911/1915/1917 synthase
MQLESHIVPTQKLPIRLQEYAVGIFETLPTRSAVKKAVKRNLIKVDGSISTTGKILTGGEIIEFTPLENYSSKKQLYFPLEVLYEDEYLAVINKPAGIIVSGNKFKTIDNALPQNLEKSLLSDAVRPRPVHRLDYPTTGLLLIGKTSNSILSLNNMFAQKEIQKTYYAITIGAMHPKGVVSLEIDTKAAESNYEVISTVDSQRFGALNLVKLNPATGRKHQLRKHLAAIKNPILGDVDYGIEGFILKGKGLYLHAYSLRFTHPFTNKKLLIKRALPKKFLKIFPDF